MDKILIKARFDSLVQFQFLLTSALAKKPSIQTAGAQAHQVNESSQQKRDGCDINTAGYEICDVGSTHVLVASKFCFANPHLMLLTSDGHQRQCEPLNKDDLTAVWSVLSTMGEDYVAFFNCGRDGGCSRLHKHMQLIPKPNDSFASFLDMDDGTPQAKSGCQQEAGANAIGMVGFIAVATQGEIDNWLRIGLATALAELGVPK
ncbi:hypothetical protein H9Q73_010833 [Fusarium xylarioides]|nr:hypothetical protein H9Q73_010833 [Fusarium xylarioides]